MSFKDITLKRNRKETSFSRTSIYNYFQTKEEIFLALLKREYDSWIEQLCEAMESKRNHYDLEENSRIELLVEFKVSYGNAMKTIMAMLEKFRKDMDFEKKAGICIFFFSRLCLEYICIPL